MDPSLGRYVRQMAFAPIGEEGQRRIAASTVVIVGVGATGGAIAAVLARAGVGRIRVIDRDIVETSNLQRQVLFTDADALDAAPKAAAAERALRAANPQIEVEGVIADVVPRNAERLLAGATCILDGTDNFETRLLVNDVAVELEIPWVYAGVIASSGQVLPVRPHRTACFRCYVPDLPGPGAVETCDTAGVLGAAVLAVGGIAAAEALKILAGAPAEPESQLIAIDLWARDMRRIAVPRDPDCPACGRGSLDFLRGSAVPGATALCGRDAVHVRAADSAALDLDALANRLRAAPDVEVLRGTHALRIRAAELDATVFADGRAIVKGTGDVGRARSFYARYVGS